MWNDSLAPNIPSEEKRKMKPHQFTTYIFFAVVILFGGRFVFAQAQPPATDKNYEATLYVVLGSDDNGKRGEIPRPIANVVRQIREDNSFSNYDLVNTYVGRLGIGGKVETKGFSAFPKRADGDLTAPGFIEWYLSGRNDNSSETFGVRSFRFGLRVPIAMPGGSAADGKTGSITSYENVGLVAEHFGVPMNTAILVGNISLPRSAGTLFLILSVRPA